MVRTGWLSLQGERELSIFQIVFEKLKGQTATKITSRQMSTTESIQCPVCLEEKETWQGSTTASCGHQACMPCFVSHITTNGLTKAVCPMCRGRYVESAGGGAGAGGGSVRIEPLLAISMPLFTAREQVCDGCDGCRECCSDECNGCNWCCSEECNGCNWCCSDECDGCNWCCDDECDGCKWCCGDYCRGCAWCCDADCSGCHRCCRDYCNGCTHCTNHY